MPFDLHAGTMAAALVLIAPLLALANVVSWRYIQEQALLWWAMGNVVVAAATMSLLVFHGVFSAQAAIVLGHTLVALAFALFLAGVRYFQGRAPSAAQTLLVIGISGSLFASFMSFGLPITVRLVAASLIIATLSAICAGDLFLHHNNVAKGASRFTSAVFASNALFFLAISILESPLSPRSMNQDNWLHLLTYTEMLIFLIGWNFGFAMMTSHRYMEMLSNLATHDDLTGILNRRAFHERASHHFQLAVRGGPTLTALAMDLDHFKRINDTFGHAAGDAVLREFIRIAKSCLRDPDVIGRVGGEEFCALLPVTRCAGAVTLAERIRKKLADTSIEFRGQRITINVSIGVAEFGAQTPNLDALLAEADAALYKAKSGGRNRVIMATPDTSPKTNVPTPLMRLIWDGTYTSGDHSIDTEHENLFSLINNLVGKIQGNAEIRSLHPDFRELLFWLSEHFRHEENILKAVQWDGIETHTEQHHALEKRGHELLVGIDAGRYDFSDLLDFLIRDIVGIHLSQRDITYFPALSKNKP